MLLLSRSLRDISVISLGWVWYYHASRAFLDLAAFGEAMSGCSIKICVSYYFITLDPGLVIFKFPLLYFSSDSVFNSIYVLSAVKTVVIHLKKSLFPLTKSVVWFLFSFVHYSVFNGKITANFSNHPMETHLRALTLVAS